MNKIIKEIKNNKIEFAKDILNTDALTTEERESYYYKKSLEDTVYHLEFLTEALSINEPKIFIDYVIWLNDVLTNVGLDDDILNNSLKEVKIYLTDKYDHTAIKDILNQSIKALNQKEQNIFTQTIDLSENQAANNYLKLVLAKQQKDAREYILELHNDGLSVKDIFLKILEPSQKKVGELWQSNQITVADEHYVTAITQLIMSELYPYIFNDMPTKDKVLSMAIEGELHELGIRMVADFFTLDGWDSNYFGASTPMMSIVNSVQEFKPRIVIISATLTKNISLVKETIEKIRAIDNEVTIFVGGMAFNINNNLVDKVGADYYSKSAEEAIKIANKII